MSDAALADYRVDTADAPHTAAYIWPTVAHALADAFSRQNGDRTVIDVGAGNGAFVEWLNAQGYKTIGIDPSDDAIRFATAAGRLIQRGDDGEDLAARFGQFGAVVSLEVVEHVYQPRRLARRLFELTKPGGVCVVSTPYHGYVKNLMIALTNSFDKHVSPLWDGGHIKFWSKATLAELFRETGFVDLQFHNVGRIPPLAKSMVLIGRRPS